MVSSFPRNLISFSARKESVSTERTLTFGFTYACSGPWYRGLADLILLASQISSSDELPTLPSSTPPPNPRDLQLPTPSHHVTGRRCSTESDASPLDHEAPNLPHPLSDKINLHQPRVRTTSEGLIGSDHLRVSPVKTSTLSLPGPSLHTGIGESSSKCQSSRYPLLAYPSVGAPRAGDGSGSIITPPHSPSVLFTPGDVESRKNRGEDRSRSRSRRVRSQHSIRSLRGHHYRPRFVREEPFVPIDPFKANTQTYFPCPCFGGTAEQSSGSTDTIGNFQCDDVLPLDPIRSSLKNLGIFITNILQKLYLNILLRLPAMYYTRVAGIFQDADVNGRDVQRMMDPGGFHLRSSSTDIVAVNDTNGSNSTSRPGGIASPEGGVEILSPPTRPPPTPMARVRTPPPPNESMSLAEWTPQVESSALNRFKKSWEGFVDSMLREWKTMNLVSALLLSYVLSHLPNFH